MSEKRPDRRDPEPQRPERPPDEDERDRRDEDLKETFPSSDPPAEGARGSEPADDPRRPLTGRLAVLLAAMAAATG